MFTGIIEDTGRIKEIETAGKNIHFTIACKLVQELSVDQSVSHNGVCLTITEIGDNSYKVTAIEETLKKSALSGLTPGSNINLERSMLSNGRFDGHIVQGHVDVVAICKSIENRDGSWTFVFELPSATPLLVDKGSICIDGISLTCFDIKGTSFSVAVIPYTYEHTNFGSMSVGALVNIEYDIIGKYVRQMVSGGTKPS